MQAIEIETEIDENAEIHLRLPRGLKPGRARVIVLVESRETAPTERPGHEPPAELAWQGAELLGDDIAPAFTLEEWGDIYK